MRNIIFATLIVLSAAIFGCMETYDHGMCEHACQRKFGYKIGEYCSVTGRCIDFDWGADSRRLNRVCKCRCIGGPIGSVFISEEGKRIMITAEAEVEGGK